MVDWPVFWGICCPFTSWRQNCTSVVPIQIHLANLDQSNSWFYFKLGHIGIGLPHYFIWDGLLRPKKFSCFVVHHNTISRLQWQFPQSMVGSEGLGSRTLGHRVLDLVVPSAMSLNPHSRYVLFVFSTHLQPNLGGSVHFFQILTWKGDKQ